MTILRAMGLKEASSGSRIENLGCRYSTVQTPERPRSLKFPIKGRVPTDVRCSKEGQQREKLIPSPA